MVKVWTKILWHLILSISHRLVHVLTHPNIIFQQELCLCKKTKRKRKNQNAVLPVALVNDECGVVIYH